MAKNYTKVVTSAGHHGVTVGPVDAKGKQEVRINNGPTVRVDAKTLTPKK